MSDERQECQNSEMPAVRTTIVGGRPPGSGVPLGSVPRGVEILIQKAAVDPEFEALLLEKRSRAAAEIELALSPAEAEMLDTVPAEQLEAIIKNTKVPENTRRSLLGKVGLATLAALGVVAVCMPTLGHRIDLPKSRGIQPDVPPKTGTESQPAPASSPSESNTKEPGPSRGIRPDRPAGLR